VIDKLMAFHRERKTGPAVIVRDLKNAADQIPDHARVDEAVRVQEARRKANRSRQRGPQELGELLVGVLTSLGVKAADDLNSA